MKINAGFFKQLPTQHPFVETFVKFRDTLPRPNKVMVAVRAKNGDIWTPEFFRDLHDITNDVFYLSGVFRGSVSSMWTPNTRVIEINEKGLHAFDLIRANITRDSITQKDIDEIRRHALASGFRGRHFSLDSTLAMVSFEVQETDPTTGKALDYITFAQRLEEEIRQKYTSDTTDIHIVGFSKMVGDVANSAKGVVWFFALSFFFTALCVYIYARSMTLTLLAVGSSLVSVIWQFGILALWGYVLDPLAILIPFLVYAIGLGHAIQQINLMLHELAKGKPPMQAAQSTFAQLLIPGMLALMTDIAGFLTLWLIPIPMIQEMAIIASVGIGLKIISNLLMLPLLASYLSFSKKFIKKIQTSQGRIKETLRTVLAKLSVITSLRPAVWTLTGAIILLGVAIYESRDRYIGDIHAGVAELRSEDTYNKDFRLITDKFLVNLDTFIIIAELPPQSCVNYRTMKALDDFGLHMKQVEGVRSVTSLPEISKTIYTLWMEGNLKWRVLARNKYSLVLTTSPVRTSTGLLNTDCTIMPIVVFTKNHKATTIKRVVAAAEEFIANNPHKDIRYHLASGNAGLLGATNDVIEAREIPSLLYVFCVVIFLVLCVYRDWRAALCCCVPLLLATFTGYWFMISLEIGLKVSTLPVLVLSVGIGVDYAFYIYSRLQSFTATGQPLTVAFANTMRETGVAIVFTCLTLALGVMSWVFSRLKFQADMGLLLAFMFVMNMLGTITVLPALATVLDKLFPKAHNDSLTNATTKTTTTKDAT